MLEFTFHCQVAFGVIHRFSFAGGPVTALRSSSSSVL
jgi:hypothetical protein